MNHLIIDILPDILDDFVEKERRIVFIMEEDYTFENKARYGIGRKFYNH